MTLVLWSAPHLHNKGIQLWSVHPTPAVELQTSLAHNSLVISSKSTCTLAKTHISLLLALCKCEPVILTEISLPTRMKWVNLSAKRRVRARKQAIFARYTVPISCCYMRSHEPFSRIYAMLLGWLAATTIQGHHLLQHLQRWVWGAPSQDLSVKPTQVPLVHHHPVLLCI